LLRRHFTAPEPTAITPEPSARPELRRADELRRGATERCAHREYEECLRSLDAAKALDPTGDHAEKVQSMRAAAEAALAPRPAPDSLEDPKPAPPAKKPVPAPPAKKPVPAPKSLAPAPSVTFPQPAPKPTAVPNILWDSSKEGKSDGVGSQQKTPAKKTSKAWSSSDVLSEPSPSRK